MPINPAVFCCCDSPNQDCKYVWLGCQLAASGDNTRILFPNPQFAGAMNWCVCLGAQPIEIKTAVRLFVGTGSIFDPVDPTKATQPDSALLYYLDGQSTAVIDVTKNGVTRRFTPSQFSTCDCLTDSRFVKQFGASVEFYTTGQFRTHVRLNGACAGDDPAFCDPQTVLEACTAGSVKVRVYAPGCQTQSVIKSMPVRYGLVFKNDLYDSKITASGKKDSTSYTEQTYSMSAGDTMFVLTAISNQLTATYDATAYSDFNDDFSSAHSQQPAGSLTPSNGWGANVISVNAVGNSASYDVNGTFKGHDGPPGDYTDTVAGISYTIPASYWTYNSAGATKGTATIEVYSPPGAPTTNVDKTTYIIALGKASSSIWYQRIDKVFSKNLSNGDKSNDVTETLSLKYQINCKPDKNNWTNVDLVKPAVDPNCGNPLP